MTNNKVAAVVVRKIFCYAKMCTGFNVVYEAAAYFALASCDEVSRHSRVYAYVNYNNKRKASVLFKNFFFFLFTPLHARAERGILMKNSVYARSAYKRRLEFLKFNARTLHT